MYVLNENMNQDVKHRMNMFEDTFVLFSFANPNKTILPIRFCCSAYELYETSYICQT